MSLFFALMLAAGTPAAAAPTAPAPAARSSTAAPAAPAPAAPPPTALPPAVPAPYPPTSSGAGTGTGGLSATALLAMCKSNSPTLASSCFGYLAAVQDTVHAYEVWLGAREYCPTLPLTPADLRRSVLGYLAAYPDRLSGQAASVIVVALKDAWPCPTARASRR